MKYLAMVLQVIGIVLLIIGLSMLAVVFYFSLIKGHLLISAGIGGLLSFFGLFSLMYEESEEEEGGEE